MAARRNPSYTTFHPKWYRPRTPIFWWLGHGGYTKFITRELTSLAVLYAAVLLLVEAAAVGRGEDAYRRFAAWLGSPGVVVFHAAVFLALLYHAVTWLNLAPKALVLRLGRRRIPDWAVAAGHYVLWAIATAGVVWAVARG